ncbi:MAG: DUF2867 domain-containing protein [Dehalococcoidia bacterium]|nr:DUF2867 domain-containing protein [Dehalococcoidia bacterium]
MDESEGAGRRTALKRAREVSVPAGSLVGKAFAVASYADAYAIDLPLGRVPDVDTLMRLLVASAPRWADQLMWLRDRIVSMFGLRTSRAHVAPTNSTARLQPDDVVGIFTVCARSDDEILFGGNDRHLNFRASILIQRGPARSYAVVTTVVHFNNWLGRAYFIVVRPFHRLIVSSMLRNLLRQLEQFS